MAAFNSLLWAGVKTRVLRRSISEDFV